MLTFSCNHLTLSNLQTHLKLFVQSSTSSAPSSLPTPAYSHMPIYDSSALPFSLSSGVEPLWSIPLEPKWQTTWVIAPCSAQYAETLPSCQRPLPHHSHRSMLSVSSRDYGDPSHSNGPELIPSHLKAHTAQADSHPCPTA